MKGPTLILLCVLALITVAQAGKKDGKTKLTRCQQAVEDAQKSGTREPQCTKSGKFVKKQCDDKGCWCVKARKGRPAFKNQKVPLDHPYDCSKKPKICLKKNLEILLDNPKPEWLPECDSKGLYLPKQCEVVLSPDCPAKNRKKRATTCDETPSPLGFAPQNRAVLDTAKFWTMVSTASFSKDAEVKTIEVYSGAAGRRLRVGIYRPTGTTCQFKLIQQKEWASLNAGLNKLTLSGSDVFQVKAGDRYGFTWLDYGVIDFDYVSQNNYCENPATFEVGQTATLAGNRHGKRDYSIRLLASECTEKAVPAQALGGDVVCDETPSPLGFAPQNRGVLDTAKFWTMVSTASFSKDAEVKTVEVYSGAAGRRLRVGIYRPTGTTCQFKLIQQKEWASLNAGLNKLTLSGSDVFQVKAGDRYGFTWLDYGVIDFDYVSQNNYCENPATFEVGQTATLAGNRHGKRDYSIRLLASECTEKAVPAQALGGDVVCDETPSPLGFAPQNRGVLDTAKFWTMVSTASFSKDAEVKTIEVYSGAAGRRLRVGIYRPTGTTCQFKLIQQKEWASLNTGFNKLTLSGSDVFQVKAGDRYGFTWLDYGVIDFDYVSQNNYCENPATFEVGQTATLAGNRHGKRDYSIRLLASECKEALAPAPVPAPEPVPEPKPAPKKCQECWCVKSKSGTEIKKSRTFGELTCE